MSGLLAALTRVPGVRLPLSFTGLLRQAAGGVLSPPPGSTGASWRTKPQIQALDRTAPTLPVRPGLPASRTHDNVRHGTTTLFAALEVATGKVTDACYPRHRHQEFPCFLKQVAKGYPRVKLHIVCDNYATHKHANVGKWLAKHPRITLHFTPTSASWLNLVETFFAIITRQAIRRGSFTSVDDLIAAIRTYIDAYTITASRSPGPRPPTRSSTTASHQRQMTTDH